MNAGTEAWVSAGTHDISRVELAPAQPVGDELLVECLACGVCRTDLHLAEGDLAPHRPDVVPGHEIVGRVDLVGPGAGRFALGERIGIAWLRHTCGRCRFCARGDENLCIEPRFTGWDADGGYAEYAVVDERYAYRLPEALSDEAAAPLLCAGIIGYRAPEAGRACRPGDASASTASASSAHLASQVAHGPGGDGPRVHPGRRGPGPGPRSGRGQRR